MPTATCAWRRRPRIGRLSVPTEPGAEVRTGSGLSEAVVRAVEQFMGDAGEGEARRGRGGGDGSSGCAGEGSERRVQHDQGAALNDGEK
jgi:hypothetical protein